MKKVIGGNPPDVDLCETGCYAGTTFLKCTKIANLCVIPSQCQNSADCKAK